MGGVVLPPLIAAVLPTLGWREVWRIGAVFVAVVLVPAMFFIVRHKPTEREGFHYVGSDAAATGADDGGAQIGWREVLARKNFWLVICGYLPLMGVYAAYGQNLAPHAASHGLSQQSAGTLLSIFSVVHLVSTFGLGPLSDRFSCRFLFLALAITSATGAVIVAFGASLATITLGCALIGSAGGFNTLLAVALASEFGARGFGRAFGMSFFPLPLGSAMAVVVAKIQEATGSYAPGLIGMAVIVLIGGFLSLLMDEKPKVAVAISH
jgi:nitrate/nitrite transporter NarK